MKSITYYNQYPTVFIHGFTGFGPDNGLNRYYRYWGSFTKDLMKELGKRGYEVYNPSLGPFNSMWDRCCDLYAYLFGGTADYGKVHSEKNGHARYGRTYPGVLKDLGGEGNHKKFNLVGHSFGGPTVCLFSSLLYSGAQEEIDGTPEEELSPLFKGGHGELLHTVTTLSGTNNGTSLIEFIGEPLQKLCGSALMTICATLSETKAMQFYDFKTDHFGIMGNSADIKENKLTNPISKWSEIRAYAESDDNIFKEMGVEFSRNMAEKYYEMIPSVYYFARRACRTHTLPSGRHMFNVNMNPLFYLTSPIIGRYKNKRHGIDESWFPNDGCVPIRGMNPPENMPQVEWIEGMTFESGLWHTMPIEDKDHQSFAGMLEPRFKYFNYYSDMLELFRTLPDA